MDVTVSQRLSKPSLILLILAMAAWAASVAGAIAAIENSARATGNYGGTTVTSEEARQSVPVAKPTEAHSLRAVIVAAEIFPRPGGDRNRIAIRISGYNDGSETLRNIGVDIDLAEIFGTGRFQVDDIALVNSPEAFGAAVNPFYDGAGDTALLTSGGAIAFGERLTVDLIVTLAPETGIEPAAAISARISGTTEEGRRPIVETPESGPVPPARMGPLSVELELEHQSAPDGDRISVLVEIAGSDGESAAPFEIVGRLLGGYRYVAETAMFNGEPLEPRVTGDEMVWRDLRIAPGEPLRMGFRLIAPAGTPGTGDALQLHARDPVTGAVLSNGVRAVVPVPRDMAGVCRLAEGSVFLDENRDGIRQQTERGLAGVTVRFGDAHAIASEADGFFALSCDVAEAAGLIGAGPVALNIGQLPRGYLAAGAGLLLPLRRGRVVRHDFAVERPPAIEFRIGEADFEPGDSRLSPDGLARLGAAARNLAGKEALVRILYVSDPDDRLARRRLALAAGIFERAVGRLGGKGNVRIETATRAGAVSP